ncbi:MAG TPA: PhoPQ-activated protein PqaA family protein [Chthonomonadaceae bacterium]|nr:PhoPQ-activated protein PqaA family protein [Chthonomonadaceae bacterium]
MELPGELETYVARPDAAYRWEMVSEGRNGATTIYDLQMTSQTWQGLGWQHRLQVFVPDMLSATDTALLTVQADYWNDMRHRQVGALYAEATGLVCAALFDVPNQPLFDGLIEDGLIAYSFLQYLEERGDDWPLLYPMTKSAVRALDTLQVFRRAQQAEPPHRFVVTGASKRGWTTWLTAVVDKRVVGIIPQVYDNLNLMAQMPHQVEALHRYSEQISDYTDIDLPTRLRTPRGALLARIVDPYTYRERLALPKLLIHGSNDRYWATDAINLYWNDLVGPKHILSVPNARHSINDPERIFPTAIAFVRAVAEGRTLPEIHSTFTNGGASAALTLTCATPAREARLWRALSFDQDFRESVWEATVMKPQDGDGTRFLGEATKSKSGYMATFGEVVFEQDGFDVHLSTPVRILP